MSKKRRHSKGGAGGGASGVQKPKPLPMPCPRCKAMIDARDKLCPHCGVDTDQQLAGARVVFMLLAIAAVALIAWCARSG